MSLVTVRRSVGLPAHPAHNVWLLSDPVRRALGWYMQGPDGQERRPAPERLEPRGVLLGLQHAPTMRTVRE